MKIKHIIMTIVWLIAMLPSFARATLIDNGYYTTDTESGLDWLDFTETLELSNSEVFAGLESGGIFEGWEYAISSQVIELFNNAGGSGVYDGSYDSNSHNGAATKLLDHMGVTYPLHQLYRISTVHFFGDISEPDLAGFSIREWIPDSHFDILEISEYKFALPYAELGKAHALVRASSKSVPEPSTLAIFALGMIGLASRRLKKQSPIKINGNGLKGIYLEE